MEGLWGSGALLAILYAFNFGFGVIAARSASVIEFGVATVSFELLRRCILLLPTEGFRRAALRGVSLQKQQTSTSAPAAAQDSPAADKPLKATHMPNEVRSEGNPTSVHQRPRYDSFGNEAGSNKSREKLVHDSKDTGLNATAETLDAKFQSQVNIAWCGVLVAVICAAALGSVWCILMPTSLRAYNVWTHTTLHPSTSTATTVLLVSPYAVGVYLTCAAALIQVAAEPYLVHCLSNNRLAVGTISAMAGNLTAAVARCVLMFVYRHPIVTFQLAQLLRSVVTASWILIESRRIAQSDKALSTRGLWLFPRRLEVQPTSVKKDLQSSDAGWRMRFDNACDKWLHVYFVCDHIPYMRSYTVLALEGAVLTYGQDLAAVYFYGPTEWGVWGLVSNVGGAVCRLLFNPIESAASAAFSKAKPTHEELQEGPFGECAAVDEEEEETEHKEHDKNWEVFKHLLFLQSLVGFLGAAFGPCVSFTCVRLLYGGEWADRGVAEVLAWYCYLLALMASNGMLEAYVHARASAAWLRVFETTNVLFSAVFVGCLLFFRVSLGLGVEALIAANAVVVVLRAMFALQFIHRTELQSQIETQSVKSIAAVALLLRPLLPRKSLSVLGVVVTVGCCAQLYYAVAVQGLGGITRMFLEIKIACVSAVVVSILTAGAVYSSVRRLTQLLG